MLILINMFDLNDFFKNIIIMFNIILDFNFMIFLMYVLRYGICNRDFFVILLLLLKVVIFF